MKTTKQLNTTKTPIDIKRRLDLALRHLAETAALLGSLTETSFPPGYLHEAASLSDLALAAVLQLDTHRPLKKTERRAIEAAAPTPAGAPAPEGEVFFVMEDGRIEVAPTAAPEEVAPAAAVAETEPTDPAEARRARKRERDRASAARRRAAKAA